MARFVAGIAAGKLSGRDGAAPNAKLVSIDVMDDQGMARTSDVIAAADWILANKAQYRIKVANFSLHSSVANSFMYEPLDKAVEKLWFNGVVVVAAAGNYGYPDRPSGIPFAPGNGPVRDHGRRQRHRQVRLDERRHGRALVGLRIHARRLREPDISAPGRYKALNKFLVSDPVTGSPVFDAASWASAAKSDALWASASWSDASWASASWASASWASASWDSSASAAASWSDMSLASASWADNAEGETPDVDGGLIDPLELEAVLSGTLEP